MSESVKERRSSQGVSFMTRKNFRGSRSKGRIEEAYWVRRGPDSR